MKRFRRGAERADTSKSDPDSDEELSEGSAAGVAVEDEPAGSAEEPPEAEPEADAAAEPEPEPEAEPEADAAAEPGDDEDVQALAAEAAETETGGAPPRNGSAQSDRAAEVLLDDSTADVEAELAAVEAELAAAGASAAEAVAEDGALVVSLEPEADEATSDLGDTTVEAELAAMAAEVAAAELATVPAAPMPPPPASVVSDPAVPAHPAPAAPTRPARTDLPVLPPKPFQEGSRARGRWLAADGAWETTLRGRQVMNDSRLYRGVAFTEDERRRLELIGLLPPQVIPMHEQLMRAIGQYHAQPTNLAKNVYLSLLQDRNEVLFFRLLGEHLPEMLPVVYTPTVGEAIEHFSQEYRRPRGVFLSVDHVEDIEPSLEATGLAAEDVDLVVATDGEAILGIGDWGVGGINISLGKLALYTAAGGIDPSRTVAVVLDVGTNRQALLENPLYLGNRHERVDEATYDAFVDTFVEAVRRRFPNALLHWEDLAARNARRILQRWRGRSARSTTTSKAPARSPSPPCSRGCAPSAATCRNSESSSSVPAPPVSESPSSCATP